MKLQQADWYHHLPSQGKEILQKLQQNGFTTFVVGGAVRDLLLGKAPKDFDFVTNAKPEEISSLFSKTIAVGRNFGISIVVLNEKPFEVATFRKESEYKDARHPEIIIFSTPEEDAIRRDFTINGLFWDPQKKTVIDYVGGIDDLQKRLICTIGSAENRFSEDALRMLRALRFLSQLSPWNFTLCDEARDAIRKQRELLRKVSKERITQELSLALLSPKPSLCFDEMQTLGVWELFFPFPFPGQKLLRSIDVAASSWLGDGAASVGYYWGILLAFSPNPHADILKFALGKEERELAMQMIKLSHHFDNAKKKNLVELKEFLANPFFLAAASLRQALEGKTELNLDLCLSALRRFKENGTLNPPALLTGDDLRMLGYVPGKIFQEIFSFVRELQLREDISTREEAINEIKKRFPLP